MITSLRCMQMVMQEELDLLGFEHFGGLADADKTVGPLKPGYKIEQDPDVRS